MECKLINENTTIDEIIVESRKGNRYFQNNLYRYCDYLANTVKFRYAHICFKLGVNEADQQFILCESVLKVLQDTKEHYVNFPAYFRKSFEFLLTNFIRSISEKCKKVVDLSDEAYSASNYYCDFVNYTNTGAYQSNVIEFSELQYIINSDFKKDHPADAEILTLIYLGFSLNEAAKMLHISYYKCRDLYQKAITRLRKTFAIESK